jgi:hypothetical protein
MTEPTREEIERFLRHEHNDCVTVGAMADAILARFIRPLRARNAELEEERDRWKERAELGLTLGQQFQATLATRDAQLAAVVGALEEEFRAPNGIGIESVEESGPKCHWCGDSWDDGSHSAECGVGRALALAAAKGNDADA